MKIGDRVCYRAGTTAAEIGTIIAVIDARGDEPAIEIRLDSGARIKVVSSQDWTILAGQSEA